MGTMSNRYQYLSEIKLHPNKKVMEWSSMTKRKGIYEPPPKTIFCSNTTDLEIRIL